MSDLSEIFKAYDVRGTVPEQLNETKSYAIGVGFAAFAKVSRILIARDMRPSGERLVEAFANGCRDQGVDVVLLGLASTDLLYFAAGHLDAPGVMFTASHNPAQYNGLKACLAGAKPIGKDTGLDEIRDTAERVLKGEGPTKAPERGSVVEMDLLADFVDHVLSFVDVSKFRRLKVVADTANGMGGMIVPAVFKRLPMDIVVMYEELDGTFPNHPADLRRKVRSGGFDIGLAFDGDADRVFLVDEKGVGLSGSTTTAMLAAGVLAKDPGSTILYNLICSRAVPEVITERGGVPMRTMVGHSNIKQIMAETGAAFGGEHSAHYYFRDNFRADSGIIATMFVLELLCETDQPLSELRKPFERYHASGEINTKVDDKPTVINRVAKRFAEFPQDRLDGLTVDCGSWWFNLRESNTEPLLRLNLEADTRQACDEHVAELLAFITAA
jgi:phosphomannomutase